MSVLDKIEADKVIKMTPTLIRAFRYAGCDPACHCCRDYILNGDEFKLAQVRLPDTRGDGETTDQMLCDKCTPEMLMEKNAESNVMKIQNRRTDGGYTRASISFFPVSADEEMIQEFYTSFGKVCEVLKGD